LAASGGHACFLYESAEERLSLLAKYFQEGLANNELCVLAVPEKTEAIVQKFKNIGFDPTESIKDGALCIFEMEDTYVPNGKFIAEYMIQNVTHFIEDAKSRGYNGLRTAGEMSWLNGHSEFIDEAIHYEDKVNDLITPDANFVGLCLYPVHEAFDEVIEGVLQTHPAYIQDEIAVINPNYKPALA
jgi:hypothetical protein